MGIACNSPPIGPIRSSSSWTQGCQSQKTVRDRWSIEAPLEFQAGGLVVVPARSATDLPVSHAPRLVDPRDQYPWSQGALSNVNRSGRLRFPGCSRRSTPIPCTSDNVQWRTIPLPHSPLLPGLSNEFPDGQTHGQTGHRLRYVESITTTSQTMNADMISAPDLETTPQDHRSLKRGQDVNEI